MNCIAMKMNSSKSILKKNVGPRTKRTNKINNQVKFQQKKQTCSEGI